MSALRMLFRTKELQKGFTLVELLIVIAIIGILSAVVLVSLNQARTKGADSSIKKEMGQARRQAELFVDANGRSYDNVCSNTTVNGTKSIYDFLKSVADKNGYTLFIDSSAGAATRVVCNDSPGAWAAQAPLRTSGYYCIDSEGIATTTHLNRIASGDYSCL